MNQDPHAMGESKGKGSTETRRWRAWLVAFGGLLSTLIAVLCQRLIAYPSHDATDLTSFLWAALALLGGLAFASTGLWRQTRGPARGGDQTRQEYRVPGMPGPAPGPKAAYFVVVALVGALGWPIRGVWGHQAGALVWGTLLFPVLTFPSPRDHPVPATVCGCVGLGVGAMIPFACYPVIPRVVVFATWGLLGGVAFPLGRWLVNPEQVARRPAALARAFVRHGWAGFAGMGLGTLLENGLYRDPGWLPGWFGGVVPGACYGLALAWTLSREKAREKARDASNRATAEFTLAGKTTLAGKLAVGTCYFFAVSVMPVMGPANTLNYYALELGVVSAATWVGLVLLVTYAGGSMALLGRFRHGLGRSTTRRREVGGIFLLVAWPAIFSAILRHPVDGLPALDVVLTYGFERFVLGWGGVCSIAVILLVCLHQRLERGGEKKKELND